MYIHESRRNASHTITGESVFSLRGPDTPFFYPALGEIVRRLTRLMPPTRRRFPISRQGFIFGWGHCSGRENQGERGGLQRVSGSLVELIDRGLFDRGQTEGEPLEERA